LSSRHRLMKMQPVVTTSLTIFQIREHVVWSNGGRDPESGFIDLPHLPDLSAFLKVVRLVDADSIYPQPRVDAYAARSREHSYGFQVTESLLPSKIINLPKYLCPSPDIYKRALNSRGSH
jgi:hypothetical protein